MSFNHNIVWTEGFSNRASERMCDEHWPHDPKLRDQHYHGIQCGGCSFYARFNCDWGLCCNRFSPHFTETVFEHFTCAEHVDEGWGPHSFCPETKYHCKCHGNDPPPPDPATARDRRKAAKRRGGSV